MTAKEAKLLGYKMVKASPFEVGLTYNGKGLRTWFARDFGGKIPPLDNQSVMQAIELNEKLKNESI